MLYKSSGLKARKNAQRRPRVSKRGPKPPKIDSKAIQKASWSPSWTHVFKRYELERPTNSQNAPKSGPKTAQSVPNPSQMEPQDFPKSDFRVLLGLFVSGRKFAFLFCSFVAECVCFLKSRPLKFMRPRSVLLTSTRFGMFRKKISKIIEKPSRNLAQIEEKSKKNRRK